MMNQVRLLFCISVISSLTACSILNPSPSPRSVPPPNKPTPGTSTSVLRDDIADYGKKFVGVHYKYAGKTPATGFDCSGFTSYVMKGFGYTISPASAAQATTGKRVSLDRVLPGDLLFFGDSENKIQHVGLVVKRDNNGITCVHSTSSRGVIVENVSKSSYWKPKILFARDVIVN